MSNRLAWVLILSFCFVFWAGFILSFNLTGLAFSVLVLVSVWTGNAMGNRAGSQAGSQEA